MHVVDAERLAAIVDRTPSGTIRVGQRIALRKKIALLVDGTEGLIPDLVIDEHELTEVRAGAVLDDGLPAAARGSRIPGSERFQVARSARLDDEGTEEAHDGQLTVVAVGMELPDTLLRAWMDVPLKVAALVLRHNTVRIGGRGRCAGGAHDHGRSMDVQADVFAAFQLVAELELHTVALIGADHQRLNPLRLDAGKNGARIESFLLARITILRLFCAHLVE